MDSKLVGFDLIRASQAKRLSARQNLKKELKPRDHNRDSIYTDSDFIIISIVSILSREKLFLPPLFNIFPPLLNFFPLFILPFRHCY